MDDLTPLPQFILEQAALDPFRPLTRAQKRVVDLVARGWGNREIAAMLRSSERMVAHHIQNVARLLPSRDGVFPRQIIRTWAICLVLREPEFGSVVEAPPAPATLPPLKPAHRRDKSRLAVSSARASGKLLKPSNCSRCGQTPPPRFLHAHHADYDRPLDVEWLCSACHAQAHIDQALRADS